MSEANRLSSCLPGITSPLLSAFDTLYESSELLHHHPRVEVLEGKYAAVEARIELLGEFPPPKDTEAR